MTPLATLADRVEAAEGPSRELDGSIAWGTGLFDQFSLGDDTHVCFHKMDSYDRAEVHVIGPKGGRMIYTADVPAYTASLDAAMGLVPEGCSWDAGSNGPDDGPWACVTGADCVDHSVHAATSALALCAAALRARASASA